MMGAEYPRPEPEVWWTQAACRGHDTALWHPAGKGATPSAAKRRALEICRSCPVQVDCLEYGHLVDRLSDYARFSGIYGGLTARQRDAVRRGQRPDHRAAS